MPGRPRIVRVQDASAPVAPVRERRRVAVSYACKLEAVAHYAAHGDLALTVTRFFPEAATTSTGLRSKKNQVLRWTRERAKIAAICEAGGGRKSNDRRRGMGATLSMEAEERLVVWMHTEHAAGRAVSSKTLARQALTVAEEDRLHPDCFKASWSWQQSFLRRHGLLQSAQTPTGMVEMQSNAPQTTLQSPQRTLPSLSQALNSTAER